MKSDFMALVRDSGMVASRPSSGTQSWASAPDAYYSIIAHALLLGWHEKPQWWWAVGCGLWCSSDWIPAGVVRVILHNPVPAN